MQNTQRSHAPRRHATAWLIGLCAILGGGAHAEDIAIHAAAAFKAPVEDIAQAFAQQTGHRVQRVYDTAGAAEQRFVAGGKSGLLITTQARVQQSPELKGGMAVPVGDTVAGLAVAVGAPRGAIDTADALKQTLLAARRIAFSDPARGATVGAHFMQVITRLGIRDAVLAKATLARDGIETMHLVEHGDADIGVTQISEILQADARLLLGPFPPGYELTTRYALWHAADASDAARALAAAFAGEAGRASLQRHGLRAP